MLDLRVVEQPGDDRPEDLALHDLVLEFMPTDVDALSALDRAT
ncbi:hypothetical protein [Streptomyces cyaneus]|nr:hypothetical protein [Streptomyces cyaneus]